LALLSGREGARLEAYQDQKGIWTIGVGHTAAAGEPHPVAGMTLTETSMLALFAVDIVQYETAVNAAILLRALADHQFDACVSLCYNIGAGGFKGSSVAAYIRENRLSDAADAFLLWDHPASLTARRHAERVQFLTAY
jgi:lysozyme